MYRCIVADKAQQGRVRGQKWRNPLKIARVYVGNPIYAVGGNYPFFEKGPFANSQQRRKNYTLSLQTYHFSRINFLEISWVASTSPITSSWRVINSAGADPCEINPEQVFRNPVTSK